MRTWVAAEGAVGAPAQGSPLPRATGSEVARADAGGARPARVPAYVSGFAHFRAPGGASAVRFPRSPSGGGTGALRTRLDSPRATFMVKMTRQYRYCDPFRGDRGGGGDEMSMVAPSAGTAWSARA